MRTGCWCLQQPWRDVLGPANPRDGALPQELNKCFPSAEEMCSSQQLLFQSGRGRQTELRAKADATAPPAGSDQPCVCVCVCVTRWGVSMLKWSWHWEVFFLPSTSLFYQSKGDKADDERKGKAALVLLFINSCRRRELLWKVTLLNLTLKKRKKKKKKEGMKTCLVPFF